MSTLTNCPRCQAALQPGQAVCTICGLPLDAARLAAFAAEQQGRGLAPSAAASPGPPVAGTSGWGCLGAIWELIRGIMDIFD